MRTFPLAAWSCIVALAPGSWLTAQTLSWRQLANCNPPLAATWDSTRQCTVLVGSGSPTRWWEWDGTAARERQAVLPSSPWWLGDDPVRRELVALLLGPLRIGTWNGAQWSWQVPPSSPSLSSFARATFDTRRGRLVVCQINNTATDVFEWDGTQWWSFPGLPGPTGRNEPAFAFDPVGNRCVLYGGTIGSTVFDDCWSWDGSAWSQIAANAPPGPRASASLAWTQSIGGMLLYGGSAATTTWALAGNAWTQVATVHDPGPRDHGHLVPDPLGMLLVGGNGDPLGTAWRFTGTDWIAVATFVAPPFQSFASVAYDRARGQVVLAGGIANGSATHLFDTQWHGTQPGVSPPPRNVAQMCWSSIEQLVLLFGGIDGTNTTLADTWSWTGTNWVQRTTATSPPARYAAMLAEDPAGGVMLFGGQNGATVYGDHWHWNGTTWLQRTPAVLPSPRAGCYAALDPLQNRVVAIGPVAVTIETWEWDGSVWTLAAQTPILQSPLARRLAFDPRRGRIVAPGSPTFEWNGSSWTSLVTAIPAGINPAAMGLVTDFGRQRVLGISPAIAVLTPTPAAIAAEGNGCALGASPALHALTDPTPGNLAFALAVATITASAPTFLVLGQNAQNLPLGSGCFVHVGQTLAIGFSLASAGAEARFAVPIPNDPGLRGWELRAQGAVWDPPRSLLASATLTAGLRITIGD